jgi:glyoxylase-like metal-dependent hydrolase (beta-lactamase superfamily II)/8-oxo-dGTP pyrophosphatase MutT (NUDIX family)
VIDQLAVDVFAGARRSASLLLLRDGASSASGELEVLMLRRAQRDGDIRSGVTVFPGGVLDVRDRAMHAWCDGLDDATASARLGLPEGGLDYWVAAARECFEEVGLLMAAPATPPGPAAPSSPAATDWLEEALTHWRAPMHRGEQPLHALCEALDLRLDLSGWFYWSHWLTPPGLPQRFDTRFFVARAPAGQTARPDGGEALELMWLTPQAALMPDAGLKLLPVTRRTLQQLGRHGSVQAVLDHAALQTEVPLTMPRRAASSAGLRVVLPDEWPYAEIGRLDPTGQGDASAELIAGRAVRLSPRIIRVTAPNPGMMTGPGTNSYLVADPAVNRWTVIDPGPADASHLDALLQAAPGPIERILVTHTHVDHSPGAVELARATGAPVWGMRARHEAGQDSGFAPDGQWSGGETLALGPDATLEVLHTPGHASNHMCYLLREERLLFTGDHVMQGSTVVINPPDGDMAAYFASLRALLTTDLEWLAPGHGFLVSQPHAVIRALIAHRQRREDKVVAALRLCGGAAQVDRLLPIAYDDTPVRLHAVARRSLLAHLLKLAQDGVAQPQGETWALRLP